VRVTEPTKLPPTLKVNMAELAFAAIVIEPSVDRAGLLTVNPTATADEGAELSFTVQLPKPPDTTFNGVHTSEASEPGINKEIVTTFEFPFSDADKVALELAVKPAADAVKTTEEEPAGAVRSAWETPRLGLELDIAIDAVDPAGTAFVRLTVQVVEAPGNKKLFTQVIEDRAKDVKERGTIPTEPFREAMRVTLRLDVTVPTLAVKLAEVACAGTTTEAGIVRMLATEAEIETGVPAVGAALDNVTVQTVLVLEVSEVGTHCKDETRETVLNARVALAVEPLRDAITVAL
jgi:hypothetical protein